MAGRIHVDAGVHFATNDATLGKQDKPPLDDFARAIRISHSDAVVTVGGFADPSLRGLASGPASHRSVRSYLVSNGGLSDTQIRAISYGENRDRQVCHGASGEAGRGNRRVSLVIDYAGARAMPNAIPQQTPEPTQQREVPQSNSST